MARVNSNFRFQDGDVAKVCDDPDYAFFIIWCDASAASSIIVDDERWDEAEAFAKLLLDTITQRRTRKTVLEAPEPASVA